MNYTRAFLTFPGLSRSLLLIDSKMKLLFLWPSMGKERQLFCLMITTSFSTRDFKKFIIMTNLIDFALVKGIVHVVFHMYSFLERC